MWIWLQNLSEFKCIYLWLVFFQRWEIWRLNGFIPVQFWGNNSKTSTHLRTTLFPTMRMQFFQNLCCNKSQSYKKKKKKKNRTLLDDAILVRLTLGSALKLKSWGVVKFFFFSEKISLILLLSFSSVMFGKQKPRLVQNFGESKVLKNRFPLK